jgi:hypothetical protein
VPVPVTTAENPDAVTDDSLIVALLAPVTCVNTSGADKNVFAAKVTVLVAVPEVSVTD